jgi:small subunit ribosomal protein S16
MPVKIRLARHGKKDHAFYHVVVADSRAPRDGKFIEKIGTYNPNTNPATITLDFEKALGWLQKGAQPTDTARTILSGKGVLYMKHLLGGVAKGALTDEQARAKFEAWIEDKTSRVNADAVKLKDAQRADAKSRMADEVKAKEAKAAAIAAKKAAAEAAAAPPQEEAAAEAVETPEVAEEAVAEVAEVAEAPETPEAVEEAPAAE